MAAFRNPSSNGNWSPRRQTKRVRQCIFDYFVEHHEWPTYGWLERELMDDVPYLTDALNAILGHNVSDGMDARRDSRMQLPTRQILQCKRLEEGYRLFVRSWRDFIDVYRTKTPDENHRITVYEGDFIERGWGQDEARALGRLVWGTQIFFTQSGGHGPDHADWHWTLGPETLHLRHLASARDYFRYVTKRNRRWTRYRQWITLKQWLLGDSDGKLAWSSPIRVVFWLFSVIASSWITSILT